MKFTFFCLHKEFVFQQPLKYLLYMLDMFIRITGEDQDVIQVDKD